MTSAEDVARLNRLVDAINEAGAPLAVDQLTVSLFLLNLDVVPRRDVVDGLPGYQPPAVTVASLFERAATHVDAHDWPKAYALLDAVQTASANAVLPHVCTYRTVAQLMEVNEAAGSVPVDVVRALESDLRARVYDLLVRGPDTPAPTGQEQF